jgi:hypothetical protein
LGKDRGGDEDKGRVWIRRGRKLLGRRTMDCSTRKGEKVKGVRIGIRK